MMQDIVKNVFQLSKLKSSFLPGELVTTGPMGCSLFSTSDESFKGLMHDIDAGSMMIVVAQQGIMILVAGTHVGWTPVGWVESL